MALDFRSVANQRLNEIERPKLPPIGNYVTIVKKMADISKSKDGLWEFVKYPVGLLEPLEDVDPLALQEFGDVTKIGNLTVDFVFNLSDENAFLITQNRLKDFLEKVTKAADPTDNLMEAMQKAVGARFIVNMTHQQDKDNKEVFHARIGKMMPLA